MTEGIPVDVLKKHRAKDARTVVNRLPHPDSILQVRTALEPSQQTNESVSMYYHYKFKLWQKSCMSGIRARWAALAEIIFTTHVLLTMSRATCWRAHWPLWECASGSPKTLCRRGELRRVCDELWWKDDAKSCREWCIWAMGPYWRTCRQWTCASFKDQEAAAEETKHWWYCVSTSPESIWRSYVLQGMVVRRVIIRSVSTRAAYEICS